VRGENSPSFYDLSLKNNNYLQPILIKTIDKKDLKLIYQHFISVLPQPIHTKITLALLIKFAAKSNEKQTNKYF